MPTMGSGDGGGTPRLARHTSPDGRGYLRSPLPTPRGGGPPKAPPRSPPADADGAGTPWGAAGDGAAGGGGGAAEAAEVRRLRQAAADAAEDAAQQRQKLRGSLEAATHRATTAEFALAAAEERRAELQAALEEARTTSSELRAQMLEMASQVAHWKGQHLRWQQESEDQRAIMTRQKNCLADVHSELKHQCSQTADVERQLSLALADVERLRVVEKQLATSQQTIDELQHEHHVLSVLRADVERKTDTIQRLERDLESSIQEGRDMRRQLDTSRQRLTHETSSRSELQLEMESLQERERRQSEELERYSRREREISEQLSKVVGECSDLRRERASLMEGCDLAQQRLMEIAALSGEVRRLSQTVQQQDADLEALSEARQSIEQLTSDNVSFQERLREKQSALEAALTERQSLRKSVNSLTSDLERKVDDLDALQHKFEGTRRRLEEVSSDNRTLREKCAELEGNVVKLDLRLQEEKGWRSEAESSAESTTKMRERTFQELRSTIQLLQESEAVRQQLNVKMEGQVRQIDELTETLHTCRTRESDLVAAIEADKVRIGDLEAIVASYRSESTVAHTNKVELNTAMSRLISLDAEVDFEKQQRRSLQGMIAEKDAAIHELTLQVEELRKRQNEQLAELQTSRREKHRMIELRNSLEHKSKLLEAMETEDAEKSRQIIHLNREIMRLREAAREANAAQEMERSRHRFAELKDSEGTGQRLAIVEKQLELATSLAVERLREVEDLRSKRQVKTYDVSTQCDISSVADECTRDGHDLRVEVDRLGRDLRIATNRCASLEQLLTMKDEELSIAIGNVEVMQRRLRFLDAMQRQRSESRNSGN